MPYRTPNSLTISCSVSLKNWKKSVSFSRVSAGSWGTPALSSVSVQVKRNRFSWSAVYWTWYGANFSSPLISQLIDNLIAPFCELLQKLIRTKGALNPNRLSVFSFVAISSTNQKVFDSKTIQKLLPDTTDFSDLFSRLYHSSLSPDSVRTSITHWPKKSSLSRRIRAFTFDFISLSSSQTRTLIRSVELAHSNWNFSFHSGFNSRWIVFVRFRKLPICTVTYGSLKPVLSFACKPDQGFDLKFKSR